ncbi:MAG: GDSL-type esterase/lipase family protein, partial [Pseudomonadota bacterium]
SSGGVFRTGQMMQKHRPDWVILALGANDGLRGSSLKSLRENLQEMVRTILDGGAKAILFGMKMPPNYGVAYTQGFERAYSAVASSAGVPLLPFFIDGVGGVPELNQADGLHPTAEGQEKISKNICRFLSETELFAEIGRTDADCS